MLISSCYPRPYPVDTIVTVRLP
eukprot:UN15063